VVNRRLWRPTQFFRQPDEYGGVSTFPDERWFFINGIMTNADLARINAAYLAHLFHRPVTVVQNATDSAVVDLFECAIGKGFKNDPDSEDRKTMTEPAWRATAAILEAINAEQTQRVVVIAHSQGTIITANVLRAVAQALRSDLVEQLNPPWHSFAQRLMGGVQTDVDKIVRDNLAHSLAQLTRGGLYEALLRLAKLEVYTFANCADRMGYVHPSLQVPYMEHFANERDIVARLGVLSPLRGGPNKRTEVASGNSESLIEIDGPTFVQTGAWGHLLNEHYLMPIDDYLYPGARRQRREEDPYPPKGEQSPKPRLYGYFHGKRPVDLPPPSIERAARPTRGRHTAT
jgi:pimeloyl-ACP methyl ester carboxylesterase